MAQTTRLKDNADMEGVLSVYMVFQDTGRRVCVFTEQPNRITKAAKAYVLSAAYNAALVPNPVTTFKVGSGGTIGGTPRTLTGNETSLFTAISDAGGTAYSPTLTYVTSDEGRTVTYTFSITSSQLNGQTINEAGLYAPSNYAQVSVDASGPSPLFSIKTFTDIVKSPAFALQFVWKVRFV